MATKILSWDSGGDSNSTFQDTAKIKITYTANNGTLTITEISGYREDTQSHNSKITSVDVTVGGTKETVGLGEGIWFGDGEYIAWDATDTSWTGLSGSSIKIIIELPECNQNFSEAKFIGSVAMTYTVTYDAYGGSGAPDSQTKIHDVDLTLSTKKPTFDGNHVFKGWSPIKGGSALFQPGGTYDIDAPLTLYAVWKSVYSVTYYHTDETTKYFALNADSGHKIKITSTVPPIKKGYRFLGWRLKDEEIVYPIGSSIEGISQNIAFVPKIEKYPYSFYVKTAEEKVLGMCVKISDEEKISDFCIKI